MATVVAARVGYPLCERCSRCSSERLVFECTTCEEQLRQHDCSQLFTTMRQFIPETLVRCSL
jgi:transcription initiation factor IIE alpha subunit